MNFRTLKTIFFHAFLGNFLFPLSPAVVHKRESGSSSRRGQRKYGPKLWIGLGIILVWTWMYIVEPVEITEIDVLLLDDRVDV